MIGFRRVHSAVFGLLLAALFAVSAVAALAERVEDLPKPTDYVSDFAHVLSPEAIARLDRLCAQLDHSQTNTQIEPWSPSTPWTAYDPADFSNALEDKWKIVRKGSDRGVLVLLAVDDHKRRSKWATAWKAFCPTARWAISAGIWFPR
jgi:uncharacterized protein